eukprot:1176610-Amphidinium_carterae.2
MDRKGNQHRAGQHELVSAGLDNSGLDTSNASKTGAKELLQCGASMMPLSKKPSRQCSTSCDAQGGFQCVVFKIPPFFLSLVPALVL